MVKQSPSRNYRSKGIKVKHVLQICGLLAICFWLIYQVKHSHDKKKAFDEHAAKMSGKTLVSDEVLKFGRKDIQSRLEETGTKNDKLDEEEETGGEEDNKNEEEEREEDNKNEDKEDEAKGGDDEIDEGDQEKSEMEVEREEDFIDGENEREEGDEKEAEEKEGIQNENLSSLEDHDRDGGSGRNAHEAREENYRGDDASSAVTHETETVVDNSTENTEMKVVEEGRDRSNNTTGLYSEKGEMGENGISPNVTRKDNKGSEMDSLKSEGSTMLNSTTTTGSDNQLEVLNTSTEGSLKSSSNFLSQNETETKPDVAEAQNATVKDQSSTNIMISNNTENADAAVTGEVALSEKVVTSNSSVEAEAHSGLLTTEENAGTAQETNNGTDKSWESSESGNADIVQHDPIDSTDSSVPFDEKDVNTDGTLPEIRTEGIKNGYAAAQ